MVTKTKYPHFCYLEKSKQLESKVDPVDLGDKRKHEYKRDSGDEDQLQMTQLDKKRRLNSVVSKSTTDMTSTSVQNAF